MQLYYFETMNPRKACATAKYLDLPVTYVRLAAEKGEHKLPAHLARNPNGKVPVLVDGDLRLWESVAIMAHLSVKAGSDLWPAGDPARQVEVLRWVSWDAFHFVRFAGAYYFEHAVKPMLGLGAPDPQALAAAAPGFHESAGILDRHLSGRKFLLGDRLSIADFVVGVLLPQADEIALPIAAHPSLCRYRERLMAIDAFCNPWPAASAA